MCPTSSTAWERLWLRWCNRRRETAVLSLQPTGKLWKCGNKSPDLPKQTCCGLASGLNCGGWWKYWCPNKVWSVCSPQWRWEMWVLRCVQSVGLLVAVINGPSSQFSFVSLVGLIPPFQVFNQFYQFGCLNSFCSSCCLRVPPPMHTHQVAAMSRAFMQVLATLCPQYIIPFGYLETCSPRKVAAVCCAVFSLGFRQSFFFLFLWRQRHPPHRQTCFISYISAVLLE